MVDSPIARRIAALYREQDHIYATLGRGGLWRTNDLTRLADVQAALAELWNLRRQEDALRRAGGTQRCLGPTDAKTHRSRRIV